VSQWLKCWTNNQEAVGSTPGWFSTNWLLLGWVDVSGQVNHHSI